MTVYCSNPPVCDQCGKPCSNGWVHTVLDDKTRCSECSPIKIVATVGHGETTVQEVKFMELRG